jgi:inorganic pyrophosphatase
LLGVPRLHVLVLACFSFLFARVPYRAIVAGAPVAARALAIDGDTIAGAGHFTRDYPAVLPDGSVEAVVEIPAGTTAKFEVDEADGRLHWARKREDGTRREIDYLPFVANYGSVPRTLAPDGDPLDIIVLGRGIERGRIARTRIIGVLEMLDAPDIRDDKLIGVPLDDDLVNGFSRLYELEDLDARYASLCDILWAWFASYWGEGATHVVGWGDAREAHRLLDAAMRAFKSARAPNTRPAASAPRLRAALPSVARVRSPLPRRPARRGGSTCSAPPRACE